MKYLIKELYRNTPAQDTQVEITGWIRTLRDSKAFAFIAVNDGSFFKTVQVVCDEKLANFKEVVKMTLGSSIRVVGTMVLTPNMKQPFEIHAQEVTCVGLCAPEYPLQKKRHSFEFLRTQAHLRPRTNTFSAVFRIRSLAAQAIHRFFAERGFVYVHTPIITASDAEGAGEMFRVTTLDLNDLPKDDKGKVKENEDGKTVAAVDVLVPGIGELIGGSQREERLDVLEARIKDLGLDMDSYWWYLELRKFGTTPHAGFGLGFERLIMYLTGVSNIRDVLPFPRTTGSADF